MVFVDHVTWFASQAAPQWRQKAPLSSLCSYELAKCFGHRAIESFTMRHQNLVCRESSQRENYSERTGIHHKVTYRLGASLANGRRPFPASDFNNTLKQSTKRLCSRWWLGGLQVFCGWCPLYAIKPPVQTTYTNHRVRVNNHPCEPQP